MEFENRLYAVLSPNHSLVASQLSPQDFARHYTIGSVKHYRGKVIFIEIDKELISDYFRLDLVWPEMVPHEDGTPKRTKFVSNYRVLENIPMAAFKSIYLSTVNGRCLELTRGDYAEKNEPGLIRIYQQINPLQMLVASNLDQRAFAQYLTVDNPLKGCPKLCFTQIDLDIKGFEDLYDQDVASYSVLPNVPNSNLMNCIKALNAEPEKRSKTISLASIFNELPFRKIKHGFWIVGDGEMIFYQFPSLDDLEKNHYKWWRSAELA
ncbi:MAG: hypothetical protein HRT89_12900 [Lentisphaeria bacterium]|nr:hypothetical protein [Lentisphaeria bacterium]